MWPLAIIKVEKLLILYTNTFQVLLIYLNGLGGQANEGCV